MKKGAVKWAILAAGMAFAASGAGAWEMEGRKALVLHDRDGAEIPIGAVEFAPAGDRVGFTIHLDRTRFTDFFLSMREFKCLEGPGEILCHVPYPYPNPATVTRDDLRWLEHALLFLHKSPSEFGARLTNGVIHRMTVGPQGIEGAAQAVDLNAISAPPNDPTVPPFGEHDRWEVEPGARWIGRLSIR